MGDGKKTIYFENKTGKLDGVIRFLEDIKDKVGYINLNCTVEGKEIEVNLSGPDDLQALAIERLKALAEKHLEPSKP
ncbi:MAG: hypothetical protein EU541_07215 [Promethearchaeota archaeon]|nr:MAG: hypothetical protein EU541_07215 [Candidatus Lokiarchaeota archaeon]